MWKKRFISIWAVVVISLLTGCGNGTADVARESGQTEDAVSEEQLIADEASEVESVVEAEPKEPYDLMMEEWKPAGDLTNSGNWWKVTDYIDNVVVPQEGKKSLFYSTDSDGANFYVLNSYTFYVDEEETEIDRTEYYLSHFDAETMELDCMKLATSDMLDENTWIAGFASAGGKWMVFLQEYSEEEETTIHYYGCSLNQDGTLEEKVDLLPAMEQCGLKPEGKTYYGLAKWDSQGYFYLTDGMNSKVGVVDAEGNLLDVLECEAGQSLVSKCKSPDGVMIWEKEYYDGDSITYFYYGEEGIQVLYESPYEVVGERYINSFGELIFVYQSALVRWNASNGNYERLYFGVGMDSNEYVAVLQNSKEEIVLIMQEGSDLSASSYSLSGPAKTVTLTLFSRNVYDYATRSYINEFVRKHPGVTIMVEETDWDNREADWTRLLAELSAGEGPDLILLDREEMLILQDKGVLADLTDVLDEELEEQVFSGILDNGRVEDKLYGMTYYATYSTLMVSRELWQEDTWTIEDVLQVLEDLEDAGTPVEAFRSEWISNGGQSAMQIFNLLTTDLVNSSFLDLEKGECYFDTEEFCRLLEVCKRYGAENIESLNGINMEQRKEELWEYVKSGRALSYEGFDYGLGDFSRDMAAFENEYFCVGYPTEGECGTYWSCGDMLVVNAKSQERELIDELLNYLYSEECQQNASVNMGIMVRRDLLLDSIIGYVDWSDKPMQRVGERSYDELELKPDGSTYLEEYLALLDSCVAAPSGAEEIKEILSEELPAFFAGDKDAMAVAEIVQRRVQLYLDERK